MGIKKFTSFNSYMHKKSPYGLFYMNCVIDLHSENVPVGMYPVVVMDAWQHAYYRDYLKDVNSYMSAMMKQLRWPVIEKRF